MIRDEVNTNNGVKWRRFIVPKKVEQIMITYSKTLTSVQIQIQIPFVYRYNLPFVSLYLLPCVHLHIYVGLLGN